MMMDCLLDGIKSWALTLEAGFGRPALIAFGGVKKKIEQDEIFKSLVIYCGAAY